VLYFLMAKSCLTKAAAYIHSYMTCGVVIPASECYVKSVALSKQVTFGLHGVS
jgi:hypothetical protein